MNLPSFWQTFMGKGPAVETVLCVWKDLTWKSLHVAEKSFSISHCTEGLQK